MQATSMATMPGIQHKGLLAPGSHLLVGKLSETECVACIVLPLNFVLFWKSL